MGTQSTSVNVLLNFRGWQSSMRFSKGEQRIKCRSWSEPSMLLLRCFHNDSDAFTTGSAPRGKEMPVSFLSSDIWFSKLGERIARLAQGLRGSTSTIPYLAPNLWLVVALFSFIPSRISQGSKSVQVIPKRKKSHLGFVCLFCGFGLGFMWSRVLLSAKKSCLLHTGWEEGYSHFSLPTLSRAYSKGREGGLEGSKNLN